MFYFADLAANFFYAWIVWGIFFVIIEGTGLYLDFKDKVAKGSYAGSTLSELVWRYTRTRGKVHYLIAFLFTAFWVWLSYHFFIQFQ